MPSLSQPSNAQPLGIFCPQCGAEIRARLGLVPGLIRQAALTRARDRGVELICQECGHRFIYRLPEPPGTSKDATAEESGE